MATAHIWKTRFIILVGSREVLGGIGVQKQSVVLVGFIVPSCCAVIVQVVVISIGSNNLRTGDSPQTIAAGIEACVRAVRTHKKGEKQPFIIVMVINIISIQL